MYDTLNQQLSMRPSGKSKRRPFGISRKQKQQTKKQLGFETLEDRRVMSAQTVAPLYELVSNSSATPEGQSQIFANELYWYALSSGASASDISSYGLNAVPSDPLVGQQWHLINSGQEVGNPDFQDIFAVPGEDANVAPVWNQNGFGEGVVVAVVDSGVQLDHPDLVANIHPTLRLDALDPLSGDGSPRQEIVNPVFPEFTDPSNAHGTAVAGIIAASANNGIGGTGVAPNAQIVPIRLIDPGAPFIGAFTPFIDTFRFATDQIDITNNSWGPFQDIDPNDGIPEDRFLGGPNQFQLQAIRDSIVFGRDGKGVVHVFASGNNGGPSFNEGFPGGPDGVPGGGAYDSSAYNGWASTRYTIAVTGVDHDGFYNNVDGTITAYPEGGPNVLVAAPTGSNVPLNRIADDTGLGSGIVTTDLTGTAASGFGGFNIAPDPTDGEEFDRDFLADNDYTSRFNGTSAAAPIVSGVIALMLEANPDLSWRDVQEILVRSARQNAQFDVPLTGNGQGVGDTTQNTWITSQIQLFQNPDPFDPSISPVLQTLFPTADPRISSQDAYSRLGPTVHLGTLGTVGSFAAVGGGSGLVNGAGYTVSQGVGAEGELVGYGHGVIDAELAVQLAQQWTSKNQTLPDELTFTSFINPVATEEPNLPAVERSNDDSGNQFVPGKLFGAPGFISFWNEYFDDDPDFTQTFPAQGTNLQLAVPDSNAMTIENIDVKVSVNGSHTGALDHLRIALVSPSGVHHELNNNWVSDPGVDIAIQNLGPGHQVIGDPGSTVGLDQSPTNLVWTFTSNRSWGERSDNELVFDPTTNEPFVDNTGQSTLYGAEGPDGAPFVLGSALERGWTLVFENWGPAGLTLADVEVAWHGSPIDPTTKRIQGFVGLDEDLDDNFNFTRLGDQVDFDIDGDPTVQRYGEVQNIIDLEQEAFASNVTVVARRMSDGIKVAEFVTGADGNYYFDLVPGDYILSVEDPLGRDAVDDSLSPAGMLPRYLREWTITEDYFQVWDYDANLDVPINPATNAPFAWLDGNGMPQEYHVKGINFLIDPGVPPAQEVQFNGTIIVDYNGDGNFNGRDIALPGVSVFGDVNRNGAFDAGEVITQTDANGQYNLIVPSTETAVMNVGVLTPFGWSVSSPDTGLQTRFTTLGDVFTGVDFALLPPAGNVSLQSNQPGIILGSVFEDVNADGIQNFGEQGVQGVQVYLDTNNSGVFDGGDIEATTNVNGSYVFTGLTPGQYNVRVTTLGSFAQVSPFLGGAFPVTLGGNGTVRDVNFAIRNTAVLDFGDLPASFGVTTITAGDSDSTGGGRHRKGNWFLGDRIDTELNGQPSANADGDDLISADEDGVTLPQITANSTATFMVDASLQGGFLTGWIDFDGSGTFEASERLEFSYAGQPLIAPDRRRLLDAGPNQLTFEVPDVTGSAVYARFRFSEYNIDSPTGLAQIGEVEDYLIPVNIPGPLVQDETGADFNGDGMVGGFDFLSFQRNAGMTSGASHDQGDANADGAVNGADLAMWEEEFGDGAAAAATSAGSTGDFSQNGGVDGEDLLAWQRGSGNGTLLSQGDGNFDDQVNDEDLSLWQEDYGNAPLAAASSSSVANAATSSFGSGFVNRTLNTIETTLDFDLASENNVGQRVSNFVSDVFAAVTTLRNESFDFADNLRLSDSQREEIAERVGEVADQVFAQGERIADRISEVADRVETVVERIREAREERGDQPIRERLFARLADGFNWRQI